MTSQTKLRSVPLLVAAALIACVLMPTMAMAVPAAFTGGADQLPGCVPNDHTPIAVHISAAAGGGLAPSTAYYVKVRYTIGTAPDPSTNRGFTWNPSTREWVHERDTRKWPAFPAISTDASGALDAWAFAKFGDDTRSGDYHLMISLSATGDESTFNATVLPTVTVLDSRAAGSWVHNGVATGKDATVAVAVDASAAVLALGMTEAQLADDDSNGVVDDEDWGPAGAAGDFHMSVPASTAIGINLGGEAWAPGSGFLSGPADVDLAISADDTVAPSAPGLVGGASGDETSSLTWTAATDNSAAVSGYYVYRWSPSPVGAKHSPVHSRIATLSAAETTFADSGLTNGTTYLYEVRAFDAATNVGPRSATVTITPPVLVPAAQVSPASPDGVGGWYVTDPTVTLTPETSRTALYSFEASPSTWTTYTGPIEVPSGVSSLTYRDTDGITMRKTATLGFKVDTSTPTAAISAPAITVPGSNSRTFRVSWSGADSASGIAGYEVQYNSSGSWVTWRSSTSDTSAWFTGAAGSSTFFRVRAFDAAGNVGAWSAPAPAVVPFDQSKARFSGSWKTTRSSAYYLGSSRYNTKKGGYATLSFTTGTLYLVAKKGPKMGKMAVYLGSTRVGTVNLHSSTNKYRQVIRLLTRSVVYGGPAPKTRTVKLVNLGAKGHSRVEIDGFARN